MDPYRNRDLPTAERVTDLLGRMTLAEKAGSMMITHVDTASTDDAAALINDKQLRDFNVRQLPAPVDAARWANRLQEIAAGSRLGIPVLISTDPRHAFAENLGTALAADGFSQWPEPLGLGALDDPDLVMRFADIARQEYLAVGIRGALHPQIDLTTEPRWARAAQCFGESAAVAERLVAAYLRGFQGARLGPDSVACMTKHFPGGGPQRDGEDPHFEYGREQVYPGGRFAEHLRPFRTAIEAETAAIMPYYGMPVGLELDGKPVEQVGFAYNKTIITGLLREQLGYDGVVCTDWGLITDQEIMGLPFPARAWGVEHLSPIDRVAKIIDAGCDQFGGESCPEMIIELVEAGRVDQDRIDQSVRRLLTVKFDLGLFDDPYVDEAGAADVVGDPEFVRAGAEAQRRSITVLSNAEVGGRPVLPLPSGARVFAPDLAADVVTRHGVPVDDPADAEVALLRLKTPYEPRNDYFLEAMFHAGSLEFDQETRNRVAELGKTVPVILDIYLDRPAILGSLLDDATAIVANYGCSGDALLDVLFGAAKPQGRLPFELPRSMAAVQASRPDVGSDTADPAFRFGHGLDLS